MVTVYLSPKYARITMPSALRLNHTDKIRQIELQIWSSYFVLSILLFLTTPFLVHRARVCRTGFGATFAALFILNLWLREFPLSASLIALT